MEKKIFSCDAAERSKLTANTANCRKVLLVGQAEFWGSCGLAHMSMDLAPGAVRHPGGRPRSRRPWQVIQRQNDADVCSVCLDATVGPLDRGVVSLWQRSATRWQRVCPHQFCKACMTQAVARNPRCPICRRPVEFLRVDVRVTGGVARDRGCIPVGDCARRELERRRGEPGAVIADGDIAASAGGGGGAAEAAAADEEMAAAAAAAYAAEEQEQQDEEEQVSLAEAAASAAARERREVQAVLAAAAASAARREMVEAQERSDRCLASRLRAELRAEGRCWLLALVLAGELHEGISDVDARERARAAMRRNLTLRVEAHGWVLRSVGDVNEGRRGARRAGRGGSDGGGGGELPPLAALLARSGLGLVVTSLRGADAASRALAEDAVRERLGRQLGAVRG